MTNLDRRTNTAGAYVLCDGYFVFMFGFGSNHGENELGVARLGGHREKGESAVQCAIREVREEASLDIALYRSPFTYFEQKNEHRKNKGKQETNPILVLKYDNRLSLMYLAYGSGALRPAMETQGILLLRKEDIAMICADRLTFGAYKKNGGKFVLVQQLPEQAILVPHTPLRFLNKLFDLESEMMAEFMKAS